MDCMMIDRLKFIMAAGLLLLAAMMLPAPAHAACSGPAATEGVMVYDTAHDTMVFCDGTDWISMGGGGGGSDTLAGLSCSSGQIAAWNGTAWACAADATGGGISDGDKGDVSVSASGATWTIDSGAVTAAKTNFVGTLTNTKWCTTNGTTISCTSDAPGGEPAGTLCGLAFRINSLEACASGTGYTSIATCNGASIVSSCPSGYTLRSVQTGAVGSYTYCTRFCSKN
jgi:hypothetical protein